MKRRDTQTIRSEVARYVVLGIVAIICALVLGALLVHAGPTSLDVAAFGLRGHGIAVAEVFTAIGRGWPLGMVALLSLGVAFGMQRARGFLLMLAFVLTQLATQALVELLKHAVGRARPDVYFGAHEVDLSYPSGHAATAAFFFVGLAVLLPRAGLPRAATLTLQLVVSGVAAAIVWSRLALGAHYATDVIGGLLFGSAMLALFLAASAAVHRRRETPVGGRRTI